MSLRTAQWAMYESAVEDAQAHRILGVMVDVMDGDGRNFFRSQAWLAEQSYCSLATVKRKLAHLESLGVIKRGDQSVLDKMNWPKDRRPIVWDAVIGAIAQYELEVDDSSPDEVTVAQTECERQLTVELQDSPYTPQKLPKASPPAKTTELEGFDEFWKAYPHRPSDPKGRARINYAKALKQATPEELLAGAQGYAKSREGEDKKFNKGAANWLTEQGWLDYMPEAAGDVIAECLADGSMERLEELSGLVFEANYLALQDLRGEQRKAALLTQWRVWVEANRERLETKLCRSS